MFYLLHYVISFIDVSDQSSFSILHRHRFLMKAGNNGPISYDKLFPSSRKELLSGGDKTVIQDAIRSRDNMNQGMARKECVESVMTLAGINERRARWWYGNHTRRGNLPMLANKGREKKAQSTTTKRMMVTEAQQRRWHAQVSLCLDELRQRNGPDFSPDLEPHFVANTDETCFQANEGTMKVIADIKREKVNKNTSDSKFSVTSCRTGTAAGGRGPWIFLGSGTDSNLSRALSPDNLRNHFDAPIGSRIFLNESGYMNDETWPKVAERICIGLRSLPVKCDCFFVLFCCFILFYGIRGGQGGGSSWWEGTATFSPFLLSLSLLYAR